MRRSTGRAFAPGFEQTQGGGGVGNLVAEVVGDAAEGVDALEVGADAVGRKKVATWKFS